ncbi:hypothetical protein NEMBOFW57_005635 [Staphylotrichum longicolle]|uniref:Uncharacterized protein n=1 Tax=Staphylotrichum longicolle TaxID=669026 RepID=A0AAD4EXN7_9PEZI|nr:hypothetical protein NEMBOFW57_005635 [Staphylotrichum longicolle]
MMFRHFLTSPPSKLALSLAVLPLVLPVAYLVYLDRVIARHLTTSTGVRNKKKRMSAIPPGLHEPTTLPPKVASDDSEWVLAYERIVSEPVDPSRLHHHDTPQPDFSAVLTRYVRATMTAFSWTPQAFLLRASAGDGAVKRTFETPFIQGLGFREGDRVNGFWRVVHRGDGGLGPQRGERVEMALDAPAGYRGPVVHGVVVAGVEILLDDELSRYYVPLLCFLCRVANKAHAFETSIGTPESIYWFSTPDLFTLQLFEAGLFFMLLTMLIVLPLSDIIGSRSLWA